MFQKLAMMNLLRMISVKKNLKMHQRLRLRVALTSTRLRVKIASTILQNKNHNLTVNVTHRRRKTKTNNHQRLINRKIHSKFSQILSRLLMNVVSLGNTSINKLASVYQNISVVSSANNL